MNSGEIPFLGLVLSAFATFALVLGYRSYAEWRHNKRGR